MIRRPHKVHSTPPDMKEYLRDSAIDANADLKWIADLVNNGLCSSAFDVLEETLPRVASLSYRLGPRTATITLLKNAGKVAKKFKRRCVRDNKRRRDSHGNG